MKILAVIPLAFICGCAVPSAWVATSRTDQFTDITERTVSIRTESGPYGWNKLNVFVSTRTNTLFLGVKSLSGVPVGTVQLRIDQNPMVQISPDETPIYMSPALPGSPLVNSNLQNDVMMSMSKIMSPFTATTGDKATNILKQMLSGSEIRYRTVGINEAASTTGKIKLDSSFKRGLQKIGMETNSSAYH